MKAMTCLLTFFTPPASSASSPVNITYINNKYWLVSTEKNWNWQKNIAILKYNGAEIHHNVHM